MDNRQSQTIFSALLYGGASALLIMDTLFLVKALLQGDFVPVLPIIVGILIAAGLFIIVLAEQQGRAIDKKEHRRLSRVANQLERPIAGLQEDLEQLIEHAKKLPSEHRMKLKRMESKTKILLENVRDVFLTLRIQGEPVSRDVRVYDLCVLIKDAAERVAALAKAHNVEVRWKTHCQDAPVRVDKHLFLIALTHLLENGILYSLKPGLVNIAVIRSAHTVRIVVQDRGIGVKQKDVLSIFLPFARGDHADQFDPDGIGVGLTLSRYIIEEFGGSLVWRPRKDATGSEFEMKLPLAK